MTRPPNTRPLAAGVDPATLLDDARRTSLADDPLSAALGAIRIWAMVPGVSELSGSWGFSGPTGPGGFYAVLEGRAIITADVHPEPVVLHAGDAALITRGAEHVVRSDAKAPVRPVLEVLSMQDARSRKGLRVAGAGSRTRFVCGALVIDGDVQQILPSGLPGVFVVKGQGEHDPVVLSSRALAAACEDHSPGAHALINAFASVIFVQMVRAHARSSGSAGASGALLDEHIGPVLGLIHGDPAREWSLADLANESGLSRTAFHERFTQLVGRAPLRYLRERRMLLGAELLLRGEDSIKEIARRTGYASEGAFSSAFKKWSGKTPLGYRGSGGAGVARG